MSCYRHSGKVGRTLIGPVEQAASGPRSEDQPRLEDQPHSTLPEVRILQIKGGLPVR